MSKTPPRLFARMRSFVAAQPILAVAAVVMVGVAAAAITLTYTTTSTVNTSVTPPPIQFVAGADAGPAALTDYVTAFTISTNKTYLTSTVKGVPEASLVVGSYLKLRNVDAADPHSVTLTTTQVTNAYVTAYTLQIYNGTSDALAATLDLRAASPTASFTIGPGEDFYGRLTLTLATGAGADNVALTNALTLVTV